MVWRMSWAAPCKKLLDEKPTQKIIVAPRTIATPATTHFVIERSSARVWSDRAIEKLLIISSIWIFSDINDLNPS